jgi:hypothetical protein
MRRSHGIDKRAIRTRVALLHRLPAKIIIHQDFLRHNML